MCNICSRNTGAIDDTETFSDEEVPRQRIPCDNAGVDESSEEPEPATAHLRVEVHGGGNTLGGVIVTATPQPEGAAVVRATANGGAADFGDVAVGTWRVAIAFQDDDANDQAYVLRPGHMDVDLVEDDDHTETIDVDPKVRIRLGYQQTVVQGTWVRFFVPRIVGSGGNGHVMSLHFTVSAGMLEYRGTSPADPVIQSFGVGDFWHTPDTSVDGAWHYAQVTGADADVTVWLYEEAFARSAQDYDADALIPWNFYFWSSSRLMSPGVNTPVTFLASNDGDNASGRSPFQKLDRAFELDTNSFDWESNPAHDSHNDLGRAEPNPNTWQGHCNWMGAASIVFQAPGDTAFNEVDFDAEDLKLLMAEYAANHTRDTKVWELSGYADTVPRTATSVIHLVPAQAADDPGAPQWRRDCARDDRVLLGRIAVGFFTTLRAEMGTAGWPLLLDMRAAHSAQNARGSSDEVWNQASFFYTAWYSEHENSQADHAGDRQAQDLCVLLKLHANADKVLPTTIPPATYADHSVAVSGVAGDSWSRSYTFRLQFTNGGNPADNDVLNSWDACTNEGDACFLPRYLARIDEVLADAVDGGGNPFVTGEILDNLGAVRNGRY